MQSFRTPGSGPAEIREDNAPGACTLNETLRRDPRRRGAPHVDLRLVEEPWCYADVGQVLNLVRSKNVSDKSRKVFVVGRGALVALAIAAMMLIGAGEPTSAQFFNFGGFQQRPQSQRGGGWFGGGWFGNDSFGPYQQRTPQPRRERRQIPQTPPSAREDFSRAPPPAKRDTIAERNVLVLGDSMADWLAYGLEDAYAEQPEMGVIRRHKTTSGLIRYQPKGEPSDWTAAAKGILASEKPDAIVVMLGLDDRTAIREPAPDKSDTPADKKNDKNARSKPQAKPGDPKPGDPKSDARNDSRVNPKDSIDSDLPQDDVDNADAPQTTAPRTPNGLYEFRDARWIELYSKKIEDLIGVLKTKGVPVLWVGLPAIRGQKGTADMLFLDSLYRKGADKAGITYVDVWDGFVDEAGRFLQKGPDLEGQPRNLRTDDGVYFTRPGARKLAHYVEREITRVLAGRSGPIALPSEPATPDMNAVPGQPAPRPLAGPIVPLDAASISTDQLLGGPGSRPAAVDALAARTLVKGEPLTPPAGRADDYSWPRREVGSEPARSDTPVVSAASTQAAALLKPHKHRH
jgi:hypothetical protein